MANQDFDFWVDRSDWRKTRFVESEASDDLAPGHVRFRIDRFAFTANNISYAKAGDMLRYWDFFPAEGTWGRIPTMGFGDVVASTHPDVAEGERVFGFFPMSRTLVIRPERAQGEQIVDGVENRVGLAPAYNAYSRVTLDRAYAAEYEDQIILMRGLFLTSFLAHDAIADQGGYGATRYVIGSASSKTGLALAYLVAQQGDCQVVGLTSPRNEEFVRKLGCYDEVVHYSDVESLDASVPTVFVDMAGNGAVTNALHHQLGDNMKYSCAIGATHWDATPRDAELPGATPEFFFAPGQLKKRSAEWGPGETQQRIADAWAGFCRWSEEWLTVRRHAGRAAVEQVYHDTLEGRTLPNEGHVLSLQDEK